MARTRSQYKTEETEPVAKGRPASTEPSKDKLFVGTQVQEEELHESFRGPLILSSVLCVVFLTLLVTGVYFSWRDWTDAGDFFALEADVAYPGWQWMATRLSRPVPTIIQGVTYPSAYAALVAAEANDCRNFNAWINAWLLPDAVVAWMIQTVGSDRLNLTHYLLCYLRNFMGATVVYYGTASLFHYFCYVHPTTSEATFEGQGRKRPSLAIVWNQIRLAQSSLWLYTLLPVLDEWLVEHPGWTKVQFTIQAMGGWSGYTTSMLTYVALVEVGIYWMHRTLHTNKFLYKHVHLLHHQYKTADMLTPWASIAFHPLDGILQASPYVVVLFLVPCHYLTHFGLLFFTAIWATYIHDAMDWNIDPIMGSKYHTVHHTHYIYNYGQVFTFCDRLWGTLRVPMVRRVSPKRWHSDASLMESMDATTVSLGPRTAPLDSL